MAISDRTLRASREAANKPLKIIGIVSQENEMFAVAGDVAIVAAAVQESGCPHYTVEGGFHGDVPWISVRAYEWQRIARVLTAAGYFPSIVEISPDPPKPSTEPDPFDSNPPKGAD